MKILAQRGKCSSPHGHPELMLWSVTLDRPQMLEYGLRVWVLAFNARDESNPECFFELGVVRRVTASSLQIHESGRHLVVHMGSPSGDQPRLRGELTTPR